MKKAIQILFLFCLMTGGCLSVAFGQNAPQPVTTEGTDFWVAFPKIAGTTYLDKSLTLSFIVISSSATPMQVVVAYGISDRAMATLTLDAGGSKEYTLTGAQIENSYLSDSETPLPRSVHIYAKDGRTPFYCFAYVKAGTAGNTARDATLLLPERSLGLEYMIQTYPQDGKSTGFVVVATQNQTTVNITPFAKTFQGKPPQTTFTQVLNRGHSLWVASCPPNKDKNLVKQDTMDMSGSLICADKPVAVYAANEDVKIPMSESLSSDFMMEQVPPITGFGTEFYVANSEKQKLMYYQVTALYDNTEVTEQRYNSQTGKIIERKTTLQAGTSFTEFAQMNEVVTNSVIRSNSPVLCYTYFSSAFNNATEIIDEEGNIVKDYWSDPANAMVPSWDQRVQDISFFSRELKFTPAQGSSGEQYHYVQVTVPTAETALLQLDGNSVDQSLFKKYGGNQSMSWASIPLMSHGAHRLTTTGQGFTGSVYDFADGIAYLYTLGYRPDVYPDSLFITNEDNIMSSRSYDLERMKQGWYQRQFKDWPIKDERLDTAIVCNNKKVDFLLQSGRDNLGFVWEVWKQEKGKSIEMIAHEESDTPAKTQPWQYMMTVEEKRDLKPEQRPPFTDYEVRGAALREYVACPQDKLNADTLRTIVRVLRSYNDTVRRIICTGDSITFFRDKVYAPFPSLSDLGNPSEMNTTVFVCNKTVTGNKEIKKFRYQCGLGFHRFTRKYESRLGCDSIVTFELYVYQSPDTTKLERVLLHDSKLVFPNEENAMFAGKTITKPGIYTDKLYTVGCKGADFEDALFHGCDSIIQMRVHLRDTLYDVFCDETANPELYGIKKENYHWKGHSEVWDKTAQKWVSGQNISDNVPLDGKGHIFEDSHKTVDGCDSSYVLILTREERTIVNEITTVPSDLDEYVWRYGDDIGDTIHIKPNRLWDNKTIIRNKYKMTDGKHCPEIFHLEVTFIQAKLVTTQRTICDIDTIHHRETLETGEFVFAGDKYKQQYPNLNVDKNNVYRAGKHNILLRQDPAINLYHYLQLHVKPSYENTKEIHLFDYDTIRWDGNLYAGSKANAGGESVKKRFSDGPTTWSGEKITYPATDERCDSVWYLNFYIHQEKRDTVCRDTIGLYYDINRWGNHIYKEDNVTFRTLYTSSGKAYSANKLPIDVPGTYVYYDSLNATGCTTNCDAISKLTLTVLPSYYHVFHGAISEEQTFVWDGVKYGGVKTNEAHDITVTKDTVIEKHHEVYVGTKGCDSTVVLYLRMGRVYRDTIYDFVCEKCTYDWYRTLPDGTEKEVAKDVTVERGQTKIITDAYPTILGLDSMFVLSLTGMPAYNLEKSVSVCQEDADYIWEGHDPQEHVLWANGERIERISLRDTGWVIVTDSLHTRTIFKDPHGVNTRQTSCDSIWTLRLYVKPVYNEYFNKEDMTDVDALCSNETFIWQRTLYVGPNYDKSAKPINPAPTATYDEIKWLTEMDFQSGLWMEKLEGQTYLGCDSIRFLELTLHKSPFVMRRDTIGDNNTTWEFGHGDKHITGSDFHVDNYTDWREVREYFFIDTITLPTGCDSIVHDSLWVMPSYRFDTTAATCSANKFDWRKYKNLNWQNTGFYYDSLRTSYGVDSVFALYLRVIPDTRTTYDYMLCKDKTIDFEGIEISYDPSGEHASTPFYSVTYKRMEGCDSIIEAKVHFYDYYHYETRIDSACQGEPYIWTTDGRVHTHALRDEKGRVLTEIPTDTIGWITIYDSLHTSSPCHCDSTYTLRLYVRPSYYFDTIVEMCSNDTVYWQGKEFTPTFAGEIRDSIPWVTKLGCDSVYRITMHVHPSYYMDTSDIVCASQLPYYWPGHSQKVNIMPIEALTWEDDSTFVLWDSCFTALHGCDSVYRRTVTVKPIRHTWLEDTICEGEGIQFHDHWLTKRGSYTDTLVNQFGCDSTVTLRLATIPLTRFTLEEMPRICADDAVFDVTYSFRGVAPLSYMVLYDSLARKQGFENIKWTGLTEDQTSFTLPLPVRADRLLYPRPDKYEGVIYFDNGYCSDSLLMAVPFDFTLNYPSWLMEQHWDDVIGLLTDSLNGGYSFAAFQWYKNGELIPGETKPYLYCPQYLEAGTAYSVALTRAEDYRTFMTCPIIPDLSRPQDLTPSQPYVAVVPTLVVRQNPVVNILCVNHGTYEIYDTFGLLYDHGTFVPGAHNAYEVRLPAVAGVYLFRLNESSGLERTVKVLVK